MHTDPILVGLDWGGSGGRVVTPSLEASLQWPGSRAPLSRVVRPEAERAQGLSCPGHAERSSLGTAVTLGFLG